MSMDLCGEFFTAVSKTATWSSQLRTSHLTNCALLDKNLSEDLKRGLNWMYPLSSSTVSFPAFSLKSAIVTYALQLTVNYLHSKCGYCITLLLRMLLHKPFRDHLPLQICQSGWQSEQIIITSCDYHWLSLQSCQIKNRRYLHSTCIVIFRDWHGGTLTTSRLRTNFSRGHWILTF
jgi:hypothetical protein